jgi:hypothetical protein
MKQPSIGDGAGISDGVVVTFKWPGWGSLSNGRGGG